MTRMLRALGRNFAVALLILGASPAGAEIVALKTRGAVTQSFALLAPANPTAAVVLFAGGAGKLPLDKLTPADFIDRGNFLVRSRYEFQKHGLVVAVVDSPSDRPGGMLDGFRGSDEHATDIAAVVAHIRSRWPVPVWLVGTSRGTESVAFLGAKLQDKIAGMVLTSSMAARNKRGFSVFEFPLETIRVPVQVIAHKDDSCGTTLPAEATRIANAFTASPRKQVLFFEGGRAARSDDCGPLSPHGFYGIEKDVVAAVAKFIRGE